jgi:hypothetical protein
MRTFLVTCTVLLAALFGTNTYADLVGVDFGNVGQTTPINWTSVTAKGTYNALINESGAATAIGLVVTGKVGGDPTPFAAGVNAGTIPSHTNSLANIGENIYKSSDGTNASQLELKFTGLQAGTHYQIYVFGLRDLAAGLKQDVSIQGEGTATTFHQEAGDEDLVVNGTEGNSANNLLTYSQTIVASAGGEIIITITADSQLATDLYAVAGVAIDVPLATGTPSSYAVTVTKVEMYNGTTWVEIFSGTAALDLVTGGTFPGIGNLVLSEGTYSQIRVTFNNSFPASGGLSYGVLDYYTTATAFGGQATLASTPTNTAGSMAAFTFRNPAWGALNTPVTQTFGITPVTVEGATDYEPTLRFTISGTLLLKGVDFQNKRKNIYGLN